MGQLRITENTTHSGGWGPRLEDPQSSVEGTVRVWEGPRVNHVMLKSL